MNQAKAVRLPPPADTVRPATVHRRIRHANWPRRLGNRVGSVWLVLLYNRKRKAVTRLEIIAVVWVVALAAYVCVPAFNESRVAAMRAQCLVNLSQIGGALSKYMNDNDQRWPSVAKLRSLKVGSASDAWNTLPAALSIYLPIGSPAYRCPADRRSIVDDAVSGAQPAGGTYYETEGLSYEWWWGEARAGRKIGEETISKAKGFGFNRADQHVLTDFEPFHVGDGGGTINNLFADFVARTSRRSIP